METQELIMTAVRALGIYVIILILIRLMGKRQIGAFSAFDFLVALMLGEVVDEIIYGDVTFLQGSVAILVIVGVDFLTGFLSFKNKRLSNILEGVPTILIRNGEFQHEALRKEMVNKEMVMSMLREQEINDLREVKLGILENSGHLSVIREEWAEPLQKADLGGEEQRQKEQDTGKMEEPSEEMQTYSRRSLGLEVAR